MPSLPFPNISILLTCWNTLSAESSISSRVVNPVKTVAEAAQNFAPAQTAAGRKLVDADAIANQRHRRTEPRHTAIEIGDVDRQQVDRRRPRDGATVATDHDLQRLGGRTRRARIAVGMTERY